MNKDIRSQVQKISTYIDTHLQKTFNSELTVLKSDLQEQISKVSHKQEQLEVTTGEILKILKRQEEARLAVVVAGIDAESGEQWSYNIYLIIILH